MEITNPGFRTDLMLQVLSGGEVTDRGDYLVVRTDQNPGFWWGNFLLFRSAFAPGDVATRTELFQAEFPAAKYVALGIDTVDGEVGAADEVLAAGFEIEPSTVMSATEVRPPARPNTTATVRQVRSDDDWAQVEAMAHLTSDYTQYEGFEEFVHRRYVAARGLTEGGRGAWFGAFDGDRLLSTLGIVSDGGEVARYQVVQTHPEARNQGLASTLVHRAAVHGFEELGAKQLVMVADPGYLAIRIYRSLGFSDNETQLQLTKHP